MSQPDNLKETISLLPHRPGVYQFFNAEGKIIYVGKAKDLRKRVASYFVKEHENAKTRILVRKIAGIKHLVVNTETDALLLENNLIKKYQPRYNILLKDDKSFPWICIKNEHFPRVFSTRNVVKDGSLYFGPYTSVRMVRALLDLFKQLYKLRTCNYTLSRENIAKDKFKVCLEYHIGNCKAPCVGKQQETEYNEYIGEIKKILKGSIHSVILFIKERMTKLAEEFRFEEAHEMKLKLESLEKFQAKSTIVNAKINNVDVFSIESTPKEAYINYLKVVNGAIIQAHTVELRKKLNESESDLLSYAITDIRQRFNSTSPEIILPFEPEFELENVRFTIPKIGDKRKLLALSARNAKYYRMEKEKQKAASSPENRNLRVMKTIQKDLHLKELPVHIECFDNSNIQGTHPVAACVVFKNANPSKKDYRHFNIKTVDGPDDFASMREVVFRRYRRLRDEGEDLPQLIVIDGGKGQLTAAVAALKELNLYGKIAVISIAKRLEEIYFPGDSLPLYLDKNSESLKVIQRLRNEAHRFGITFHRDKRSKTFVESELDKIKGVGEQTTKRLLKKFVSVKGVKEAALEELAAVVGKAKAKIIYTHFH